MAVVNDHTVKAFDEDLNRLRGLISEMGGRAEQALLQALLQNPGRVLSAEQLKDAVYGLGDDVESNALNVHIHHLRRKLGNGIVETVRGIGYRLGPAGHASAPTEAPDA